MTSDDHGSRRRRRRACPMCSKPAAEGFAPFCSRSCADRDLGNWLEGNYRIPAVEPPDGFDGDGGGEDMAGPGGSAGKRPD